MVDFDDCNANLLLYSEKFTMHNAHGKVIAVTIVSIKQNLLLGICTIFAKFLHLNADIERCAFRTYLDSFSGLFALMNTPFYVRIH